MDDFLSVAVALMYFYIYDLFIRCGLYETARAFRQQVPTPALLMTPLSPTNPLSPIDDEEVLCDNSTDWRQINYATDQSEWEALQDDADSSYKNEYNMWAMWQQSDLMPSIHQESIEPNEQMVEERILDDIFGTDNQEPVSKEGCSCSQDAYLYDSSTFSLGNEDDNVICGFSFDGYHEAPYNDEIQGVTVGGNLVLQTTPNPEGFMLSSTPANVVDTCNLYEHHESSMNDDLKGVTVGSKFAPEIMSNTENPVMCLLAPNLDISYCYSCVPESSGMKRKWFEEFGDGGDLFAQE